MAFSSVHEMIDLCKESGKPLYEVILESDLAESGLTRAESEAEMHRLWAVMRSTSDGYCGADRSMSGFAGGDAAKVNAAAARGLLYADGYKSPQHWVGGSSIEGRYGMAGMWYDAQDCTLEAKKSWLMAGDEIVALGAGISSTDGRTIETTVENRKMNPGADYRLTLDGEADGRCELTVEADPAAADMDERLSFALSGAQMPVLRMERREASLEDVFIRLTADDAPAEKEGGEA